MASRRRHLSALAASVVVAAALLTGCGSGDDAEPASPVVQLMNISAGGGKRLWFAAQHRPTRHPDGDVRSELCVYLATNGPATASDNGRCQWEPLDPAAPVNMLVGCAARVTDLLVIGIVTDPSLTVLQRTKDVKGHVAGLRLDRHRLPRGLGRRGYWFGASITDRTRLLVVGKRRGRAVAYLVPREGTFQLCSKTKSA